MCQHGPGQAHVGPKLAALLKAGLHPQHCWDPEPSGGQQQVGLAKVLRTNAY